MAENAMIEPPLVSFLAANDVDHELWITFSRRNFSKYLEKYIKLDSSDY